MASTIRVPSNTTFSTQRELCKLLNPSSRLQTDKSFASKFTPKTKKLSIVMASTTAQSLQISPAIDSKTTGIPIMVNGCTGKMGRAVIEAAITAGLCPVPVTFGRSKDAGKIVEVCGKQIEVHGPSQRENVLSSVFEEYPNLVVVDYTVPAAVNENAKLYSKVGVPFVMGTTGGDRELLYKTVAASNVYAVISPQMGKQVVAFIAAMEIMAEQFPGAFSGYNLQVLESHQASKLDVSGTLIAVISCFKKLGVSFELDQVEEIRDSKLQVEMMGVPEEHLSGHAFHTYHLTSPDGTVKFKFQHNVCGRSVYAEGTIDAVLFLAKKVSSNADKRIYNMIDVLREGNMRLITAWNQLFQDSHLPSNGIPGTYRTTRTCPFLHSVHL